MSTTGIFSEKKTTSITASGIFLERRAILAVIRDIWRRSFRHIYQLQCNTTTTI